jgi:L-seryl-tRNA(Ser) seleniumtransferase
MSDPRRALPSVGALLASDALRPLLDGSSRPLVTEAVRAAIEGARHAPQHAPSTPEGWASVIRDELEAREQHTLRGAFNATGVILHTNLGRAPLADVALDAIARVAAGYATLEYDVARGERGSRHVHCRDLLCELTGAEDAVIVNNCAAALVLTLNTLADGRDAIISRGELIEIGGSFRVPDIMARSGARLVEVGTTNRTHVEDYERMVGVGTGAIVKVHRSNFVVQGYAAEVSVADLAKVAARRSVPLVHDFGSGLLVRLDDYGLSGEPTALDAVAAGATVVTMSGDKLLGGPQAGIILGTREAVGRIVRNPLMRALRVDKLTIAALQATLALYRDEARAVREIPVLAMLTQPVATVRARAERIVDRLRGHRIAADVVASEASVGGGAFPTARIPSFAVAFGGNAMALEAAARTGSTPVIGRIADGRYLVDARTIPARDEEAVIATLVTELSRVSTASEG